MRGDKKLANYWGFGISFRNKVNDQITFTGEYDLWNQPTMDLGGSQTFNTTAGLGTRISLITNYQVKNLPIGIHTQIGYKTTGYLEGEQLDEGWILRIGLMFKDVN